MTEKRKCIIKTPTLVEENKTYSSLCPKLQQNVSSFNPGNEYTPLVGSEMPILAVHLC